jgi:hypothetical protein
MTPTLEIGGLRFARLQAILRTDVMRHNVPTWLEDWHVNEVDLGTDTAS